MKRIRIHIDPDLDAALTHAAALQGRSKAALIHEAVAERYSPLAVQAEALMRMAGMFRGSPDDSASIDEVVYRRS